MELPEPFVARMRTLLGGEADLFFEALDQTPPVSVRKNAGKDGPLPAPVSGSVAWCPLGHYLAKRPSFTFDPLFHAGCYYVQEASSMFLWRTVEAAISILGNRPLTVLDLCAAPGGKSTLLCDALPDGSLLVANEVVRQRANVLAENLAKWGCPNVIVTQADPSALGKLKGAFDLILTDVPCSGEGMFRKQADALSGWSTGNVALCAERQREILTSVWPALKPGGCLIYSTCTYNREEDEENVAWICSRLGGIPLPVECDHEAICPAIGEETVYASRFFPHRTEGEGLFMALLQKEDWEDSDTAFRPGAVKAKESKLPPAVAETLSLLTSSGQFVAKGQGDFWTALPTALVPLFERLQKNRVYMLSAGVPLGELKGKDLVPDTALALSTALDPARVVSYGLTLDEATAFLSREMLVLPPDVPKGYVRVCYQQHALGWVKHLGNRANNLYPAPWRIRTAVR